MTDKTQISIIILILISLIILTLNAFFINSAQIFDTIRWFIPFLVGMFFGMSIKTKNGEDI